MADGEKRKPNFGGLVRRVATRTNARDGGTISGVRAVGSARAAGVQRAALNGMIIHGEVLLAAPEAFDVAENARIPDKDGTACAGAAAMTGAPVSEHDLDKCAKTIADANVELGRRASCAGAEPGQHLDPAATAAALNLIARSAKDMFRSNEVALSYLDRDNFGGTGFSTRELLALGRGTSVIARLDSLRYGSRG